MLVMCEERFTRWCVNAAISKHFLELMVNLRNVAKKTLVNFTVRVNILFKTATQYVSIKIKDKGFPLYAVRILVILSGRPVIDHRTEARACE